jgi:hypothetical protein
MNKLICKQGSLIINLCTSVIITACLMIRLFAIAFNTQTNNIKPINDEKSVIRNEFRGKKQKFNYGYIHNYRIDFM